MNDIITEIVDKIREAQSLIEDKRLLGSRNASSAYNNLTTAMIDLDRLEKEWKEEEEENKKYEQEFMLN